MKIVNKISSLVQKVGCIFMFVMLSTKSVFAKDLLVTALDGDVQDTFGGNAKFWTIFILIDVVLATSAAVATKNPKVFFTVFFIAFIPGMLLKTFVFN